MTYLKTKKQKKRKKEKKRTKERKKDKFPTLLPQPNLILRQDGFIEAAVSIPAKFCINHKRSALSYHFYNTTLRSSPTKGDDKISTKLRCAINSFLTMPDVLNLQVKKT